MLVTNKNQKGYTLVELSISIGVMSLLATGALSIIAKTEETASKTTTIENIAYIQKALKTYVRINGELPCPADGSLMTDNASYARASTYDSTTHQCTEITGILPVHTLHLKEKYAYDGWDRYFTYRIASGMGSSADMEAKYDYESSSYLGDITIRSTSGTEYTNNSVSDVSSLGAAYVVISHGANGTGAWTKNSNGDPTESSAVDLEYENANHSVDSIYMQGNITSQYDDITAYAYKYDLVLYKKITSPRFIDNVACENAQTIVRDGDVNKTNDLADFHTTAQGYTTANQKNLATQIHISSKQLLFLCNNPPTIEEVSWGAEFSVSDLDGANGYKIEGSTAADKLGDFNIEFAGDINDDGFDDFVITSTTSTSASTTSGAGYLIFGRTSNSDFTSLNVSSLNGINGVLFEGAGISTLGRQALYAGDINGDNIDDFMISTINGSQNGASSGSVYIIFGSSNAWGATFDLTTLDGSNGFRIDGNNANDELGRSIDYAGDINGDNISDIIISAYNTDKNGSNSGSVYIIFGKQQVWNATYDISDLADGLHGAELYGGAASNGLGSKIAGIGNFNNDKFADFIVTNLIQSGSPLYHYVVYGRSAGWTNGTDITTLSSTQATRFDSASVDNNNVNRVSGLGDINGDGINDISIGISAYGTAYAVFGQSASWGATVDLSSDLDGSNGFEINGESSGNTFPTSIKILQDVNNDDIDDILIGDQGEEAGYIIFGKNSAWSTTLDVSTLDGINGTKITGENVDDAFGDKVGTTGDINQDGINDVIISASKADPNGSSSGAGYVIFGKGKSYQIVDE